MIPTEDILFTTGFTLLSIGYFLAVKADKEKSKILNKITGTGEAKKMTNGDNVRKMNDNELETLFNNIEYYAKKCESSNWYKCDTCDCPWCNREGDVDFGKWLKETYEER